MSMDAQTFGQGFKWKEMGLGIALLVTVPALGAADPSGVGKAVSVSGKVLLRYEAGSNLQTGFLKSGDAIAKGAIINTGSNGAVKLLMTDRTIIDLGPSSLFKVNEYQLKNGNDRTVDLSLDYGTARGSINQPITNDKGKFTIRTKAATMGVRGTELIINAPITETKAAPPLAGAAPGAPAQSLTDVATQTQITVVHGKVQVESQNIETGKTTKSFEVNSGMQFSSETKIDAPKVVQLPPQEIVKIKADAYQKDMTFLQAVSIDPIGNSNEKNGGPEKGQNQGANQPPAEKGDQKDGAKQTFEAIAKTIEVQTQQAPPPVMTDLKLPGMFNPNGQILRPLEYQNGVPIRMTVNITM